MKLRPFLVVHDPKSTWRTMLNLFDLDRPCPTITANGVYGRGHESVHIVWAASEAQIEKCVRTNGKL